MRRLLVWATVIFLCFFTFIPGALADEEPSGQAITLQQAIEMALERDEGLKKAQAEIDRTKYLRDYAADQIKFTPVMGGSYSPQVEISWYKLLSADLQWQMSKKSAEAARDSLVLKVCKSYWDVQAAETALEVQELVEQQALLNLRNARAGFQVGAVSQSEVIAAEAQYEQAKAGVEAARRALDNAYNSFNSLVGLDPSERPELVDVPRYAPLEVPDLEAEVEKIVESGPAVWLAEQKVTLQKWAADMMFYTGEYTPYMARQVAVEQAELDAASAKKLIKTLTKGLYFQAKSLEQNYRMYEEALRMAQESLRVAKARYDVGMATKAEVVAKEVEVAKAKQQLDKLVRDHAYLKLAFEKPWAVSGSGSSTGSSSGQ